MWGKARSIVYSTSTIKAIFPGKHWHFNMFPSTWRSFCRISMVKMGPANNCGCSELHARAKQRMNGLHDQCSFSFESIYKWRMGDLRVWHHCCHVPVVILITCSCFFPSSAGEFWSCRRSIICCGICSSLWELWNRYLSLPTDILPLCNMPQCSNSGYWGFTLLTDQRAYMCHSEVPVLITSEGKSSETHSVYCGFSSWKFSHWFML